MTSCYKQIHIISLVLSLGWGFPSPHCTFVNSSLHGFTTVLPQDKGLILAHSLSSTFLFPPGVERIGQNKILGSACFSHGQKDGSCLSLLWVLYTVKKRLSLGSFAKFTAESE